MSDYTLDAYFSTLRKIGLILHRSWGAMKRNPIIGPSFTNRLYCLGSLVHFGATLHEVSYYVIDTESRFPLSCADTKAEALSMARNLLAGYAERIKRERALLQQEIAEYEGRKAQQMEDRRAEINACALPRVPSIPRRRRQIFEAANGQCHYCGDSLTLEGRWHVEHKMPKALGGGNEPGNLVASCVPCNMKKRDTTDHEFKARLAGERA